MNFLSILFIISIAILLIASYFVERLAIKKGRCFFCFIGSIWHSIKQAIINNTDVQKLRKKHILFFKFIKERLDKTRFWGLPATLLFLAFIYTLFLFVGIIKEIITVDGIIPADIYIINLLSIFRNAELTKFFLWITLLGEWQIVCVFTLAITGFLWLRHKRTYIVPFLITILGTEIFKEILKIIFHRSRPELAVYIEHSFSFPSGHAAIAVAFYGFLIYMLVRNIRQWKTKVNICFAGIVIILLIGFSRLYLGVHYVSDVWGGYLLGVLWLIIGISISEWLYSKGVPFSLQIKIFVISIILILLLFLFYIAYAINYHLQIRL